MDLFSWIISVAVVVAVILFAIGIIELRSTARTLRNFIETTDRSMTPVLREMHETLARIKKAADDLLVVSANVKVLSGSAREVGENVQKLSGNVRSMTGVVGKMTSLATTEVSGLKAGFKVAFGVLLKRLISNGGKVIFPPFHSPGESRRS